jgi:hypothetical protein
MKARPAPAHFPYNHRSVEELDALAAEVETFLARSREQGKNA